MIQAKFRYFARKSKSIYVIKLRHGTICMRTAADEVSHTNPCKNNNSNISVMTLKKSTAKHHRKKALKPTALQTTENSKQDALHVEQNEVNDTSKELKYERNLIVNHAQPRKLKKLVKKPYLSIPGLTEEASTRHELTCRACMESKMKRVKHKRTTNHYARGEAFSIDIMGPLLVTILLTDVERYFIYFIDVH